MSSTAKYSKKSEETNFQAAEEHHGVGKKQKTRNERKGDGLIKGNSSDSEYLSWFQRNRRLVIIVAIVTVLIIGAIVAIVVAVLVAGSKSKPSDTSQQSHTLAGCPNFDDKERTSIVIGSICFHYVELPTTKVTYDQAQADCQTRSGHLMTIADNSTQTALVTSLTDLLDSHTILLGLKKDGNAWRWITGKQSTYVNWNPASTASGDCAAMRLDKSGLWEPVGCGQADWYTVYVCEYAPSGSSSGHLTTFSILMHAAISLWITLSRV